MSSTIQSDVKNDSEVLTAAQLKNLDNRRKRARKKKNKLKNDNKPEEKRDPLRRIRKAETILRQRTSRLILIIEIAGEDQASEQAILR